MEELERKMNESIIQKTGLPEALVGKFDAHPQTGENSITIHLADAFSVVHRDFCALEKIDCSSQSNVDDTNGELMDDLSCPGSSKNKQCGEFKWAEYGFSKDGLEKQYCIAMSTVSPESGLRQEVALHDRDSCGDYGATRLWFRSYDGNEMFEALMSHLSHCKENLKQKNLNIPFEFY